MPGKQIPAFRPKINENGGVEEAFLSKVVIMLGNV